MRTCPSCGRSNPDDRDFCECGEYLRWELSGVMEAVAPPPPAAAPPPPAAAAPPPPPAAAPPPPPAAPPAPAAPAAPAAAAPPPPAAAAPPAPAPPAPAAPPTEPALASVTLRVPDVEATPGETVAVGCEPGGRVRLLALVRNASGIVDNYRLEVEGVPPAWCTILPNPVYLNPYGTAGAYEQEVDVQIHPPRSPEAEARVWQLQVVAHSAAYGREAARAPLVLGIQPYEDFEPRLKPEKASGRRRAEFDVSVRNKANAAVTVALGIEDPEAALRGDFRTRELEVPAGDARSSKLTVSPPLQIWVGRAVEHRFEVLARTGEEGEALLAEQLEREQDGAAGAAARRGLKGMVKGPRVRVGAGGVAVQGPKAQVKKPKVPSKSYGLEDLRPPGGGAAAPQYSAPLLPTQAVFRQKPWVPRWLAVLLALLVLAAVLAFLLLPRDTTVPDVRGETVFEATKAITEAELALNPVIRTKVDAKAEPGTILDQTPAPGEKLGKDRVVSLVQAVGTGTVRVPDVLGRTFAEASKQIDAAKLQVGAVNPPPPEPEKKVRATIPAPGEVVKAGKAVQVFLVVPKKEVAEAAKKAGGPKEVPKGPVPVPALAAGATGEAAAAALAKAGMAPKVKAVFSDQAPAGQVIETTPPAGTPLEAGSTVTVLTSLGIPQVAYDTDQDIRVVDGRDGSVVEELAGPDRKLQPSYDATGSALAFVSGGRIMLSRPGKPDAQPVPLTSGSAEWRLPTFAPTSTASVMAALRLRDDDSGAGDLCVGPVGADGFKPDCAPQDKVGFFNVLRWAPDGRSLYAVGAIDPGTAQTRTAIYRWTSKAAFSAERSNWGDARAVTNDSEPGKAAIDLAISPDGKRMAVVSNFDSSDFRLHLTKPGDFGLTQAKKLPVRACKAAWRPDSEELVIVQAADCRGPGEIARVAVAQPRVSVSLGLTGDTPVYSPVPPPAGKSP